MSVQTLLLDFSLDAARVGDLIGQKAVFEQVETVLKEYIPNLILAADIKLEGGSLKVLTGKKGSSVSIRLLDRGLVTINIEFYKDESEEPLIDLKAQRLTTEEVLIAAILRNLANGQTTRVMENQLRKYITVNKSQAYAPIKRCLFGRYYPTSDERLLEYDIEEVLFDDQSDFQKIQIVHSKSLGNMLVLDDLQNISEADLVYTETLMQKGKERYEGKEIIILGGGDGALLYELLKEKPKHVWMLEIDEMVMQACNKHMKSICGDVLERRKGDNYEILIGDCMVTVNKFINEKKKVDYIFGDLTDIPISETACGELWEFMISTLNAAFKILKPDGKFMTHGNGAASPESLQLYEQELVKLKPPVKFTKCQAFVPSFLEDWVFYQITFKGHGDA